jgi:DnaJ domain
MSLTVTLLWEKGEGQFKNGDILDALLSYMRAKQILLAESQSIFSIPRQSGSAQKIMGDIMQKLTSSIETALSTLRNNPALALGLAKGFNKLDVKKAYRRCALKYHPDKNQDCDSSCIFTAVQAAYEKLLHSAPVEYPPEIVAPVSPVPAPQKRKIAYDALLFMN